MKKAKCSEIVKSRVANILFLRKKKDYLVWSLKNKLKALGGHQAPLEHNLFIKTLPSRTISNLSFIFCHKNIYKSRLSSIVRVNVVLN